MSAMLTQISILKAGEITDHLDVLSDILVECVAGGAAISFMAPLQKVEADRFWTEMVARDVRSGDRLLFVARRGGILCGSVQLVVGMPPNQPHRAEISKMIVHPKTRRLGIGRALMEAALEEARQRGKTLATLDTKTGDVAEPLYRAVGFETAGVIPDFAWDADGRARHGTTYMYCYL